MPPGTAIHCRHLAGLGYPIDTDLLATSETGKALELMKAVRGALSRAAVLMMRLLLPSAALAISGNEMMAD